MNPGESQPPEDRSPSPVSEPARSRDEQLSLLEDYLHSLPYDRTLPDLSTILRRAGVGFDLIRDDDRARKVLHEAIVARPLASHDAVARVAAEVELLTLEVEVLTERLRDETTPADEVTRVSERLAAVRARLEELRTIL